CIYITTIVERYPNYLTGEFIRYLDGSLGFISQLKSVGAFTHRLNGKAFLPVQILPPVYP
ncbi:hypothetical protein, partial [Coleofasciculus sp. G2-EDA-02]|uniref:hypothetical protein n=1 Tax=Coleofasciculus sp. G2-EDA-02 TaxID=3069529 RepID=UPI0032FDBD4E